MSEKPESYWQPFLGDVCGLRPSDLGELTPQQLDSCADYAEVRLSSGVL